MTKPDDKGQAQSTPVLPSSGRASSLQALLDSGEGHRLIVDSVLDYAVLLIDPEGRVASWNPGAERLLGYRREEILGHESSRFFTPDEVARGVPEEELNTAARQGRAADDRWHVRKDGTYFFGSGITTPVRDATGAQRGYCKVMRDRTAGSGKVLSNLLHNAAKFTADGGSVSLSAERPDDSIILRVKDDGIGIPPDLQPHVFELFKQGSRSLDNPQGGLGIGLTLARQLVEMHGGTIQAHSPGPGQGSEFTIRLPAIPRAAEPDAAPQTAAARPVRPLQILVVDDNEDTAEMMSLLLGLDGHEVRVAHSGPSALEAAAAQRPDVIVLDIGLPGLDGYQVAQRLRQDPAFRKVVLIAASGYGQEGDRRRSWEAGFDHHLVKPVDPDEIQRLLAEAASSLS